jgi:high-affinity iron transporter
VLTTFVIGLREGLEASLIVGIIAAFLRRNDTGGALKKMWLGVGAAIVLCLAVGVTLALVSAGLPQRQQEALESVVAAVAVAMVTYMILWMNSHSRGLKGELESAASDALARGSAMALIAMAFLAVLREGFETAVFLLAAFDNTVTPVASAVGVLLGIATAVLLGWLIYRGGTRINLSRFFRLTGVVLVLVAGGLVMSALRGAHEAGWLNVGQQPVVDFTWLIRPGSIQSALLGGLFGIQAQPVVVEVVAWMLYVVPMLAVVLWPRQRRLTGRQAGRVLLIAGGVTGVVAVLLAMLIPAAAPLNGPQELTVTGLAKAADSSGGQATELDVALAGTTTVTVLSGSGHTVTVHLDAQLVAADPAQALGGGRLTIDADVALDLAGSAAVGTVTGGLYASAAQAGGTNAPTGTTVTGAQVADLNGGRRPIGLTSADTDAALPATYLDSWRLSVIYDDASGAVLGADVLGFTRTLQVTNTRDLLVSAGTVLGFDTQTSTQNQVIAAETVLADARQHETWGLVIPIELGVAALVAALFGSVLLMRSRRPAGRTATRSAAPDPAPLVNPTPDGGRLPETIVESPPLAAPPKRSEPAVTR